MCATRKGGLSHPGPRSPARKMFDCGHLARERNGRGHAFTRSDVKNGSAYAAFPALDTVATDSVVVVPGIEGQDDVVQRWDGATSEPGHDAFLHRAAAARRPRRVVMFDASGCPSQQAGVGAPAAPAVPRKRAD